MSVVTTADVVPAPSGAEDAVADPPADRRVGTAWRVAYVLFALQLIGMSVWSAVMYSRFSITNDGAQYLQSFYLTTHGQLVPFSTVHGFDMWHDHFTLAWWPISLLDLIPPHGLLVFWAQNAAFVAAEIIALRWAGLAIAKTEGGPTWPWWPAALIAFGAVVLVADPWTYTAISFDIHAEPFACPFILLAALDFSRDRTRRAWLWVLVVLSFGDVTATWIIGLGLSAALAAYFTRARHLLRTGLLLGGTGLVWLALVSAVGGNRGSAFASYGYLIAVPGRKIAPQLSTFGLLKAIAHHPTRLTNKLWENRLNALVSVAPVGGIGIFTPWTFGVPAIVLFENNASGFGNGTFSVPGFQASPVYLFAAVGLLMIVAWLAARRWRPAPVLAGALVAVVLVSVLVWAAVWIPPVKSTWLRVSAAQAGVLAAVGRQIPTSDEVVVSQGIVGRFYARPQLYDIFGGNRTFPVVGRTVWFIIAPNAGIETEPVDQALGTVAQLAGPMHATLVSASSGIYAFRWQRPPSVHSVTFPVHPQTIPAWASAGPAGRVNRQGPVANWGVQANGRAGYILQQDYWRRPAGHYEVGVALATSGPLDVEVWDDNGFHLLARYEVPTTDTEREVLVPVNASVRYSPVAAYAGWGLFRIRPVPPPAGQELEVRVFAPSGSLGEVYSVTLLRR